MAFRPFRGDSEAYSQFRQTIHRTLNIHNRGNAQLSQYTHQQPRVEIRYHPQGNNYSRQQEQRQPPLPYVILHYPNGLTETKVFRNLTEYNQWIIQRRS